MPRHRIANRRDIVYRAASKISDKKRMQYFQDEKEALGYPQCPRCGRRYKDPSKAHFSDFKNKTRCLEKKVV